MRIETPNVGGCIYSSEWVFDNLDSKIGLIGVELGFVFCLIGWGIRVLCSWVGIGEFNLCIYVGCESHKEVELGSCYCFFFAFLGSP